MTHFSIRSRAAGAAAAGAVLVLTLGACTGGSSAASATGATGGTGGTAVTPSAEPSKAALAPLDAFYATMFSDKDAVSAKAVQLEESIAACMADKGFEYKPVVHSAGGGTAAGKNTLDVQFGTKEFAEQYGYGETTSPYGDTAQEEPVDPNEASVNAMSEAEQKAYRAALHGTGNPKEGYHWETAGCQGAAEHEALAATGLDEDQHAALQSEETAMSKSIDSDPRVSDVNVTWAACMADAGYADLAVVSDAEGSIIDQASAIKQDVYSDVDESTLTPEKSAELEAAVKVQLATLTPVEIKTAVADFTCRDAVKYTQTYQDVTVEYQQKFMDDHKAEFDAWMDSYLSAKK